MPNIIIPVLNLDKTKRDSYSLQLEISNNSDCKWPETLIAQHSDLDCEIKLVNKLLNKDSCSLIQLDVRLKRLTKGVLTHLELEAQFLIPRLTISKLSAQQKDHLNQGFDALLLMCRATMEYIHSLKLKFGNGLVSIEQAERIVNFLDEIKKRLHDEDVIYSQMTKKTGGTSEI